MPRPPCQRCAFTHCVPPAPAPHQSPPIEYNNKLYFQATDGSTGMELFVYDGMSAPTLAKDINPGSGGSYPVSTAPEPRAPQIRTSNRFSHLDGHTSS